MINSRIALHHKLEEIMDGCGKVYFQPPASIKLDFPCIIYNLSGIPEKLADNKKYMRNYTYTITLIHKDPDNDLVDKLLNLEYSSFDKSFITQGLYHYVFTIHYKNEKEII